MANPSDKTNHNENFVRAKGRTATKTVKMTASVAAEEGSILYPDPGNAGQYTIADSTAGGEFVVLRKTIASTDSDYASTKNVVVEYPVDWGVEWYFSVGAGTFTAADIGAYADLNDGVSVAVDTASKKHVLITGYISATRGKCTLAGNVGSGLALPATT